MNNARKKFKLLTLSVIASLTFINIGSNVYSQSTDNLPQVPVLSFTEIISGLENELQVNPRNIPARLDLSSALVNEAAKSAQNSSFDKAASYYRKAIFLLQFDDNIPPSNLTQQRLLSIRNELNNVLKQQNIPLDYKSRFNLAKKLRGGAKFEDAIVEFSEAALDPTLKAEALELAADTLRVIQKDERATQFYHLALGTNSNKQELHLKYARSLNKIGNTDGAVNEYKIALNSADEATKTEITASLEKILTQKLSQNPNDFDALVNMGVVLQKKGEYDKAIELYKQAEQLEPTNQTLRLNIGTLFQQKGDYLTAVQAYDSILQVNPKNSLARYYKATALKSLGDTKAAIAEYYSTLNSDPSFTNARKDLLNTIKDLKQPEEALQYSGEYAVNFPSDSIAQYNYGYQLHLAKRTEEAATYYKKAITLNPKMADAYLNLASIYKDANMNNDAQAVLQDLLKVNPQNIKAKEILAELNQDFVMANFEKATEKFNSKDYQGAIDEYKKIIESGSKTEEVYLGLGAAYQSLEKYDDAIKSYNEALKLNKENPETYYYLGSAYYDKGDYINAVETLQRSVSLNSTNKEVIELLSNAKVAASDKITNDALKDYHQKKYDIALDKFNKAIAYNVDNAYPYYYKGIIFDSKGKYQEAIENYKKAISKDSNLHIAHYLIGLSYESVGNKQEAIKSLEKFLDLSKGKNDEYTEYAKYKIQELKGKK